jgi:hypothetical protein
MWEDCLWVQTRRRGRFFCLGRGGSELNTGWLSDRAEERVDLCMRMLFESNSCLHQGASWQVPKRDTYRGRITAWLHPTRSRPVAHLPPMRADGLSHPSSLIAHGDSLGMQAVAPSLSVVYEVWYRCLLTLPLQQEVAEFLVPYFVPGTW